MNESMVASMIMQFLVYSVVAFAAFNIFFDRTFKKQREFLKRLDIRTPRAYVAPIMAETLTPISRVVMNRRRLMHDVAEIVVENATLMTADKRESIRESKDYLRTFSTTELFFTKQALVNAKFRDYCHLTSTLQIMTKMIKLRDFKRDAILFGINARDLPLDSSFASLRNVAKQLGISDAPVPNLVPQIKAAMYSRDIGYEDGYEGSLAHIISRYPEDYARVVDYCSERGFESFSDDEFNSYLEVGVLRDGML